MRGVSPSRLMTDSETSEPKVTGMWSSTDMIHFSVIVALQDPWMGKSVLMAGWPMFLQVLAEGLARQTCDPSAVYRLEVSEGCDKDAPRLLVIRRAPKPTPR